MLDIAAAVVDGRPVPGALPPGVPESVLAGCVDEAESAIAPLEELEAILTAAKHEISTRLQADQRWLAAQAEQAQCIAATGYANEDQAVAQREQTASLILQKFQAGRLPKDAAARQLKELQSARNRSHAGAAAVEKCVTSEQQVERRLVVEEQNKYLSEHPGFLDGIAEQFSAKVREFLTALPPNS